MKDDVQQLAINDNREVQVSINAMQWKHNHDYIANLNDIRRSVRIREQSEMKNERALEELRKKELHTREQMDKDRTKRYNKKI